MSEEILSTDKRCGNLEYRSLTCFYWTFGNFLNQATEPLKANLDTKVWKINVHLSISGYFPGVNGNWRSRIGVLVHTAWSQQHDHQLRQDQLRVTFRYFNFITYTQH